MWKKWRTGTDHRTASCLSSCLAPGPEWPFSLMAYLQTRDSANAVLYIYAEVQINSCASWLHHSPNELHCLRVHGVRRLCLQWSFLHRFPTFHEGQSSINVIHSLPQLVHLGNKSHLTNGTKAKRQEKCFNMIRCVQAGGMGAQTKDVFRLTPKTSRWETNNLDASKVGYFRLVFSIKSKLVCKSEGGLCMILSV